MTAYAPFATALHEAAHAVACIRLGIALRYVTLTPHGYLGGRVVPRRRQRPRCGWVGLMAAYAAGAVVEDIVAAESRQFRGPDVSVLDAAIQAWAQAYDLVAEHFGPIVAVADALLASRSALTGTQIRQVADTADRMPLPAMRADGRTFWPARLSRLRWTDL